MQESTHSLSPWDYLMFGALFVISTSIGLFFAIRDRKKIQDEQEYLMGGRKMHAVPVALSHVASFVSAITIIGTPAEFYMFGTMFSTYCISYFLVAVIAAEIYIPIYYRLGITSTYEYLEMRFNRAVRMLATSMFIFNQVMYISIAIYAPSLAINEVTGLNLWLSVIVTSAVCTFYTTLGGLKAVVWTDVFQCGMMFVGFIAIIARGSYLLGGIDNVWRIAESRGRIDFNNFELDPRIRHTFWATVIGGTFYWSANNGTTQTMVQRYLCCKSERHAKISVYLNALGITAIVCLAGLVGLTMFAFYANCDPHAAGWVKATDQLTPYFVMEILHEFPGLPGIYLCSAFSGTLSTVSSGINAMATVTLEDFVKPFKKISNRTSTWISKVLVLFYGCVCVAMVALAANLGEILIASYSVNGIILGPILGVFMMGWGFPWVNSWGALSGAFAGFGVTTWCYVGKLRFPPPNQFLRKLDLTTVGCEYGFNLTSTALAYTTAAGEFSTMAESTNAEERPFIAELFSLTYAYYTTLGCFVAIIVGNIVSVITGIQNPRDLPPGVSYAFFDHPFFCWLPKKIRFALRCGVQYDRTTDDKEKSSDRESNDSSLLKRPPSDYSSDSSLKLKVDEERIDSSCVVLLPGRPV